MKTSELITLLEHVQKDKKEFWHGILKEIATRSLISYNTLWTIIHRKSCSVSTKLKIEQTLKDLHII